MRQQRPAYTLFELILVCALLVLMAAIVFPSLDSFYGDARVNAGADMVKARLAEARSRAVEEGRPYRFEIVDATRCRVVQDSVDSSQGGAGSSATAADPDQGSLGSEDTLPRNVSFGSTSDRSGGNALKIVFLADGTARDDAEISLTSTGARPLTLRLRALTATVTAVRPAEGTRP